MSMTDPIADMLTRVRNANSAYKTTTTMPRGHHGMRRFFAAADCALLSLIGRWPPLLPGTGPGQ